MTIRRLFYLRNFFVFLFLTVALPAGAQSLRKKRALFIGNSYTYFNNLPSLTSSVAASFGDTLLVDSYAPGGYTLGNHFNDPGCISKISQGNWDIVILQAQSQEPSFSPQTVNAQTLPFVLRLDSVIRKYNSCVNILFYETWGRKFGDQSNCAFYPPVCTYTGMQNRLRSSYKLFADTVMALVAPVGEAFRASITASPSLELYQSDESHPSLEGSYLASLVFYECIFHRSARYSTFSALSNAGVQDFLQQTASAVIEDSLWMWNLSRHVPWAPFTYSQNPGGSYQFKSLSPGMQNEWRISPGTSYSSADPAHSFTAAGTYTVSHVVKLGCLTDSAAQVLQVSVTTTNRSVPGAEQLRFYPQPCGDILYLKKEREIALSYSVRDAQGRLLLQFGDQETLDMSALSGGLYYLYVESAAGSRCFKIAKQ